MVCAGVGRVLKLVLPGKDQVLHVCELSVNVHQVAAADGFYPSNPSAEAMGLKSVLKLLTLAPDFHSTAVHATRTAVREKQAAAQSTGVPYKAVVTVMLEGGADSWNIVVPHSDCNGTDLYAEYQAERGVDMAINKGDLHRIDVDGNVQPCGRCELCRQHQAHCQNID